MLVFSILFNQKSTRMKKQFILLLILVKSQMLLASGYTIGNQWRWSRDSGAVATRLPGTWLKPVNVGPVISVPGPLRLRLLNVIEGSYSLIAEDTLVLEYREEPPSNSAVTIQSAYLNVNATSPTAGRWERVETGSPNHSLAAFVIDSAYDDLPSHALRDKIYDSSVLANILYNKEEANGTSGAVGIFPARHENLLYLPRKGAVGLSKTNKIFSGAIKDFSVVPSGGLEIEYRIVATKNAKAGTLYYFRLRNVRSSGQVGGLGTVDAWDYASGYPLIATSADYNGAVNAALPDVSVSIASGFGSYTTGVLRNGRLRVMNSSKVVSTTGSIKVDISAPIGWEFDIAQPASGWSYSAGTLQTSTVSLAPGASQEFSYSLVNSNVGFAASFLRVVVDRSVTTDGNGANNSAYSSVFKRL